MKNSFYQAVLIAVTAGAFLSGCSSITDTVAASTQTFTNASEATTNVSKSSSYAKNDTEQAVQFAKLNWMNLSANMAKGQGEHLAAFATLLKVDAAKRPAFYQMTQQKFTALLGSTETTPEQLVQNLQVEIAKL